MSNNHTFWKALHSLTHPLSIAAILLLLFNDHWLRHNYPSWLTGKLGDFTWLLFAPFIAAMLFALIIPQKIEKHSKVVGIVSIAVIGLWFATAKTIPAIHWLTTETLYMIVGYSGTLRMDVTDLLTLPALFLSWTIWCTSSETKINLKPVAYVAFGLAMLGTMASDAPIYFNTGIENICETDDGFLATQFYIGVQGYDYEYHSETEFAEHPKTTYVSWNGGLTWQLHTGEISFNRCGQATRQTAIDPNDPNIQYRWVLEEYIEKSTDDGRTWVRINNLSPLSQDVRDYGNHNRDYLSNVIRYLSSPVSGIVHSETGNLILAMSSNGALIITPDGEDHWVAIDNYQLDDLQNFSLISDALGIQKFLLPTLWFLILVTTIAVIRSRRFITQLWLSVGWIHWMILVIFAHKVLDYGFGNALFWGLSALFSLIFIAAPMSLWALYYLIGYYPGAFKAIIISAILASAGYLLPLILWTQGTIPRYYVAAIFSVLLTGCVLWACYVHFKDKLPARYEPPKEKRKPKEAH